MAHIGGRRPVPLEALEVCARRVAHEVAAGVLQRALNANHRDYRGPACRCGCGAFARYAGRRERTLLTVVGELRLERAYYHCSACGAGFHPRDQELGLDGGLLSAGLCRIVGCAASVTSFAEASDLVHEMAGLAVEPKQVERAAESLGEQIAADEYRRVQPDHRLSATMYLGMDGTGVPMRPSELAGRSGKQPDGSSKTREVKLVSIWSADGRDKDGTPVRDPGSVSYSAAVESAATADTDEQLSSFALRVQREATRRGFDEAQRRVIIGDGARWIWKIADELFPGAVQIIDLYHAKGTVSELARVLFGPADETTEQWAKQRRDELERGDIEAILRAIEPHLRSSPQARTCREYLLANREKLDYPRFRRLGLCTSSGVVEAGCKLAVGTRLKRAGMHWTVRGANAIIALRCCRLSRRFDDFWHHRAA